MRFIGKIIASFTHEIKNHIAIVKESAGLMQDMITMGKAFQNDSNQYLEIIRSIEEQVDKTNSLFQYLNRFAHRMDNNVSSFNVNEILEELIALLSRYANQKKIRLEKDFLNDIPSIISSPSLLQLLLFHLLDERMENLDKNSRLIIKTATTNDAIEIRIIPEGNLFQAETEKERIPDTLLNTVMEQLGGSIAREKDTVITLSSAPP